MPAFPVSWIKLLDAQTSDGPGPLATLLTSGPYNLYTQGTFNDGTSVAIQWSLDGTTFTDFINCDESGPVAITESKIETFLHLDRDLYIRAVVSGAGASTNITSELRF